MKNGVYKPISCCLIIQKRKKIQLSNNCSLFTLRWWAQCLIIWPLMQVCISTINPRCFILACEGSWAELRERDLIMQLVWMWSRLTALLNNSLSSKAMLQKTTGPRAWQVLHQLERWGLFLMGLLDDCHKLIFVILHSFSRLCKTSRKIANQMRKMALQLIVLWLFISVCIMWWWLIYTHGRNLRAVTQKL